MATVQEIKRRDRWADWVVIGLVILALILGWILRDAVLFRTTPFTVSDISGRYPAGWVSQTGDDPLLRVRDPSNAGFGVVIELWSRPLAADADPTMVLDALALERAGANAAYRTLDTDQVVVRGGTAIRRMFTYVYVDPNPYTDRLPQVVRGMDLAFQDGGRVIVVTLVSDADEFDAQMSRFLDLVESLEY